VSAFKSQQRFITIRDRAFHFVSYEGRPANVRRGEEAAPAMWYLMVEGRRCPALLWEQNQSFEDVDRDLSKWATDHAFGPPGEPEPEPAARTARVEATARPRHWWGPT
jgi:hypothetical protein